MIEPNIIWDFYLAKILLMNYQGDIRIVRPYKELENYHQTIWTAFDLRIILQTDDRFEDLKIPLLQDCMGNN